MFNYCVGYDVSLLFSIDAVNSDRLIYQKPAYIMCNVMQ